MENRGMPDGTSTVTIASMNLHCGVGTRGQPFDVEAAVRSLDAPVIALQETWVPDGATDDPVAAAARALSAQLFRVPVRASASLSEIGIPAESGPGRLGIAILTTLPVTGYEVTDLGHIPGDVARRCAQVVTLELPGGTAMRLAGTHLTYRLASPVQLGRLIWHLGRAALPTAIAGDLNMPRQIAKLAPGYSPAVQGRTWPAELPLVQLDHVLAGQGTQRVDGTVLPPAGSDHLPVRAQIAVRR